MKRVFFILCLMICCLGSGLERKSSTRKKDSKAMPPHTIHEMMANREMAPHVAWMILWANFPQTYYTFVTNK
ncbi:hypothetical protein BH09DEP1_BH09DEP1_7180 [soil metagenome]